MLKSKKFIISLVILCMMVTLFGCAKKTKIIGKPQTIETVPKTVPKTTLDNTVTPGGVVTTPSGTTITMAFPSKFTALQNNAMLIIKYAGSKSWKTATKKIILMKSEFVALKPNMTSAAVPLVTINNISQAIDNIDKNIMAKKTTEAKISANELTRYIADAMGNYKMVIPADLMKIDYYSRDIQYYYGSKNWTKLTEDEGFISSLWQSTVSLISSTDKNIKKMNTEITNLHNGILKKNSKAILNSTKKILTINSAIKKKFPKK